MLPYITGFFITKYKDISFRLFPVFRTMASSSKKAKLGNKSVELKDIGDHKRSFVCWTHL